MEWSVTQLERKASDIDVRFDVDESQIRNADRLLTRLERTRRVKLQVDERIQRDNTPTPGTSPSASGSGINFAFPVVQVQGDTLAVLKEYVLIDANTEEIATAVRRDFLISKFGVP